MDSKDIYKELERLNVSPERVAAFISGLVGGTIPSAPGKVPGYDFMYRIADATVKTLTTQSDAMNEAWAQMKQGTYGVGSAMKTWVRMAEGWYDVALEASRGPAYRRSPAWIVFDRRDQGEAFKRDVEIDVQNPGELDFAHFVHLATGQAHPGAFEPEKPVADGAKLTIKINYDFVKGLPDDGLFISFIFPIARGPSEPLVIILLRT